MLFNKTTYLNLTVEQLIEQSIRRSEGSLAANGALSVITGKRTGRSPADKFFVKTADTADNIAWSSINQPIDEERFFALWERVATYLKTIDVFISNLQVGADPVHYLPIKVITEFAWHNLFVHQLFIRSQDFYGKGDKLEWTLLSVPTFQTDPLRDGVNSDAALIIHLSERKVLLCGHRYAGEIKKAVFSVLNYWLPSADVLPMHCAANVGKEEDVALFFGLSGTGKTTLSADPNRYLIGDDEHGWSSEGIFNFEGGCYAKCIDLSLEREPMIWNAIRHGAIMENVVLSSDTLNPDYSNARLTQNSRVAYPIHFIQQRVGQQRVDYAPKAVIFLTCDLYGVLPLVSYLTQEQAIYYFLSGYTALVGSTEVNQTEEIKVTFSSCFGAPFFPRPERVYAELFMKRLASSGSQVYLVNTGCYGQQRQRFSITLTRSVIESILNGDVKRAEHVLLPGFKFAIPSHLPKIDRKWLDPRKSWGDLVEYNKCTKELISKFIANFQKIDSMQSICSAGPIII